MKIEEQIKKHINNIRVATELMKATDYITNEGEEQIKLGLDGLIELIEQFKKEIQLETLKDLQFAFELQSDLSTKTIGYKGLCESIKQLTKK